MAEQEFIRTPLSWVRQIYLKKQSYQIFFNSEQDVQLFKKENENYFRLLQEKQKQRTLQQKTENINKTVVNQLRALNNRQEFLFHLVSDHPEYNESIKSDIPMNKSEKKHLFQQTAQQNQNDVLEKINQEQQKNQQSSSIPNQENNNHSETWTRLEKLKYIAFITTHKQLLKEWNQKITPPQFSSYVTNGNKKKLRQKHKHYLEDHPGKTLPEIAQILIKSFSFTKKEIEAEKEKVFQYQAENERILFTQFSLDSEFISTLEKFAKHQFPQNHVQISDEEHQTQKIICAQVSYRFIPFTEKGRIRSKNWKYYQMIFEIELTIPSVQITPVFDQQKEVQKRQDSCRQVKGFWISINGDRKKYFSKSQVIDQMRVLDLDNKASQIEFIHSIQGDQNSSVENGASLSNQQDSIKNRTKQKKRKIAVNETIPSKRQNQQVLISEKSQIKTIGTNSIKKNRTAWSAWSYNEHLKFVTFLSMYEPAFLDMQQKCLGYRYFKVMQKYVKTKAYDQCYDHLWIPTQYQTFNQFMQKQTQSLILNRQSIQKYLQENIHLWIKNSPMVVIERRERAKEYEIKQSLTNISDEKVRTLLNKSIQKIKIKIILNKERDINLQRQANIDIGGESEDEVQKQDKISSAKKPENKLNRSKLNSIIPLNWKDIQTKLLYEYMSGIQSEGGFYEETDKERKLILKVCSQMKVKQKKIDFDIIYLINWVFYCQQKLYKMHHRKALTIASCIKINEVEAGCDAGQDQVRQTEGNQGNEILGASLGQGKYVLFQGRVNLIKSYFQKMSKIA